MAETISVLIASYNCARFLPQCLHSISSQTRQPDEVIVVDDGSQDDTEVVMRSFPDVRYIRAEHGGKAAAFNRAVAAARGDILCHLDADDYWMPLKLERVCKELAGQPDLAGVIHEIEHVDRDGAPIEPRHKNTTPGKSVIMTLESFTDVGFVYSIPGAKGIFAGHPNTIAIRRFALVDLFPLWPDMGLLVDGIFLFGALRYGLLYLPESLSAYRHHSSNTSLGHANQSLDVIKMFQLLLSNADFLSHLSDRQTRLIKARILERTARYACLTGKDKIRGTIAGMQVPLVLLRNGLLFNWRHLVLPIMCVVPIRRMPSPARKPLLAFGRN